MNTKIGRAAIALLACVLLFLAFSLGGNCREQSLRKELDDHLADELERIASNHENVVVEKNKQVKDLEELLSSTKGQLDEKTSEAAVLAELVTKLKKSGVRQVETVTRVDTVFRAGEPVRIEVPVDKPLPNFDQLVRWENGVPVSRVQMNAGVFSAEACDMAFRLRGVQGSKDSSFLLFVKSSCDGQNRDVPIDEVSVTRVEKEKLKVLAARLGLGFSFGSSVPTPRPFLAGSLYLEWLHPHENVTLLAPQISLGSHIAAGINAVGYNVGAPLPLVDDLWLHVGGGYGAPLSLTSPKVRLGRADWDVWLTLGTRL